MGVQVAVLQYLKSISKALTPCVETSACIIHSLLLSDTFASLQFFYPLAWLQHQSDCSSTLPNSHQRPRLCCRRKHHAQQQHRNIMTDLNCTEKKRTWSKSRGFPKAI